VASCHNIWAYTRVVGTFAAHMQLADSQNLRSIAVQSSTPGPGLSAAALELLRQPHAVGEAADVSARLRQGAVVLRVRRGLGTITPY
jgi:hypothetical protein